jgi:uncharacterized iron-regulated membrane protein
MPHERQSPSGFHGAFRQSMSWFHTWVGLLLGVVLYFIFVTGTTGYARLEITRWMTPELGKQTATASAISHSTAKMAEAAMAYGLENMPGSPVMYLTFPTPGREGTAPITIFAEPPVAAEGSETLEAFEGQLDPVTLQPVAAAEVRETGGGDTLYAMHYNLHYIPFESLTLFGFTLPAWPTLIVGIATMFMLIAIVTGIVVHKKIFADMFTFRPGKGQRSWLDAHNLSSVLALPFMVMITYSGLVMYTYDYMPTVKTIAYGVEPDARLVDCELYDYGCAQREATGETAQMVPLAPMIAATEARWPDAPIKWVDIFNAGDTAATVDVWPVFDGQIGANGHLSFDGVTGAEIPKAATVTDPVGATGDVLIALHEGLYAGPMLRWLYLATGAIGAAMVATGLVLWTVKRRQRLKGDQKADFGLEFVERTNVAIIVGLLIGIAAYFWANRLLPVGLEGRADWEVNAMFLTWGATFAHAAIRPARKAWTEQLVVASVAYLAIPVLNALTTDIHLGQTLFVAASERDLVLASFDLTMFVLGLALALMLQKVLRKSRLSESLMESAVTAKMQPAE